MRTLALLMLCLAWVNCSAPDTSAPPLPVEFLRPLPGQTTLGQAKSPAAGLKIGESVDFRLLHCGLMSPIDVDGSLWEPRTGHDGRGRALRDDQLTELINGTRGTFTLRSPDVAEFRTPLSAIVQLHRQSERTYGACI